jgi:transcriptional regulator with XRE-family HTH domain
VSSSSVSSSARAAREALAARLREIRLEAGLTARALAARAGWHEAKTSRIEHAKTLPSAADIRMWCRVCGADDQVPDLLTRLHTADSTWVEWKRMERDGLRQAQEAQLPLYERTRWLRAYSPGLVPGIAQTRAYTAAVLRAVMERRSIPDDIDDAVAARMERQRVLHEGDHRFALLIEETVLRSMIGGREVMAAQLDHLGIVASLPSVSLGIIPIGLDRTPMRWPIEGFWIFGGEQVAVELVSGYLTVTHPGEIAMYARAFTELAELAVYGNDARALIAAAVSALPSR